MSFRSISHLFVVLFSFSVLCACISTNPGFVEKNESTEIHMVQSGSDLIETCIEIPSEGDDIKGMVVFIRGSGSGDMREYFPGFLDKYLREVFLKEGYALIVSNKRGIGKSTGNWKRYSSFTLMAEDVIRIVEYYSEIKPKLARNIGVVGHSQGGWVAQRVAGMNSKLDFAISLVGPVITLAEQDLFRHRNFLECKGLVGKQLERGMNKRLRTHNKWRKFGGLVPPF